jgi:hypothetical protein
VAGWRWSAVGEGVDGRANTVGGAVEGLDQVAADAEGVGAEAGGRGAHDEHAGGGEVGMGIAGWSLGEAEAEVVGADLPSQSDVVPPGVDDAQEGTSDVAEGDVPTRRGQGGTPGDPAGEPLGEGDDAVGNGTEGGARGGGPPLVAGIELGAELGDAASAAVDGTGQHAAKAQGVAFTAGGVDDGSRHGGVPETVAFDQGGHTSGALDYDVAVGRGAPSGGDEHMDGVADPYAEVMVETGGVEPGDGGVLAGVGQGGPKSLPAAGLAAGHQHDAGQQTLPRPAGSAPEADGGAGHAGGEQLGGADHAIGPGVREPCQVGRRGLRHDLDGPAGPGPAEYRFDFCGQLTVWR